MESVTMSIGRKEELLEDIVRTLDVKQLKQPEMSCLSTISVTPLNLTSLRHILSSQSLSSSTGISSAPPKKKTLGHARVEHENERKTTLTTQRAHGAELIQRNQEPEPLLPRWRGPVIIC